MKDYIVFTQFYKYYLRLNRRSPNVVGRNETGRLSSKFKIWVVL